MNDSITDMITHIRSREPFPVLRISVYDLLEHYGMGMYRQICCNRIVDEWGIDERHIAINFLLPGDLILDYIGLMICDDILTGYIAEDDFKNLLEYFRKIKHLINENNKMLDVLWKIRGRELRKYARNPEKYFGEQADSILPLIKAEISSRRIWNRLFREIRKRVNDVYVRIKYWRIFALMKQCAKETKAKEA